MAGVVETVVSSPKADFDLEGLVKNATWRELLVSLVESNELNPWDVDIVRIVESYVGVVKRMKVLDLFVPANIMLAASILVRMKSDSIEIFRQEEPQEPDEPQLPNQRVLPGVEALTPRARQQPHKRITLAELMDALEDAMKLEQRREQRAVEDTAPVQFYVNNYDIDEKIERVYKLVERSIDSYKTTTFASLAENFDSSESMLLDLFVPLLFLAHKARISMRQDSFFDEIFIVLGDAHAE